MAIDHDELDDFEMRDEYDFSDARPNPYAARMREHGSNLILLEPDISKVFRDSESVNAALRLLIKAGTQVVEEREKRAS